MIIIFFNMCFMSILAIMMLFSCTEKKECVLWSIHGKVKNVSSASINAANVMLSPSKVTATNLKLDNVRFYDRILSLNEVVIIYNYERQ